MDELLTSHQLQKYWQRQGTLSTWTDSGYNSSNASDNREDTPHSSKLFDIVPTHDAVARQKRKPWVMNAFAMTAPGHLAPGKQETLRFPRQAAHLLTLHQACGDTLIKSHRRSITGYDLPKSWTMPNFMVSSSQMCWAFMMSIKGMVQHSRQAHKCRNLMYPCLYQQWHMLPRICLLV